MASEYAGACEWYDGENSGLADDDDDEGMVRAANNIGDELGDWDEDSNPGDQVLWYGEHKGHKYDQLPPSYVEWTIEKYLKSPDTASPNIKGFKALYDRKQVWIENNVSTLPHPGKTIIWFGKHAGIAFDKLDNYYVMALVNMYHRDGVRASPDIRKFKDLYDRYNSWLVAERIRTWKSPGSTLIWFGEDKGREFRRIYKLSRPRKWKWLLKNTIWAPILKAIAREYEEWLSTGGRRPVSRNKPMIANPIGERLGPDDDEIPSDDDSYVSDDGFVVQDEDESSNEDETGELETDGEVEECTTGGDCEVDKNTSPNLDGSESDKSKEMLPGTPNVTRSSERRSLEIFEDSTSSSDNGDESEPIVSPGKRRMRRNLLRPRKRVAPMPESDSDN